MKKFRFVCLILCLVLVLQCAVLPAFAADVQEETTVPEDTAAPEGTSEPTKPDTVYTIPEGVVGDASVNNGCHTIDGKVPMSSDPALLETAQAAILFEINSGTLLYAKNPDEKAYPASLTKVMTCLLGLEHGDLDEIITVSETAIANIDPDGSSANLVAGEQMTLKNLLYCLMVASANDAGAVIAEHISGSETAFAELMNQKAAELGCTGTHFSNPHGLHDDQHYTTARDMAKIMLAALEYDEFRKMYSAAVYTVPETNMSEARELHTTNFLIGSEIIDYYYDSRVIGGKTGFTTPAGRCLMTTAEDEDSEFNLLTVVLGAQETVDEDGYTILRYGNFEETVDLIDFGFSSFTTTEVFHKGQALQQFDVAGGENSVAGEPSMSMNAIVPVDYKNEDLNLRAEVSDGGLAAPIAVGDPIGTVRVWYQNICVAQTDLLSLSASKKVEQNSIFSGGVITDEEDEKISNALRIGVKVFVILVAVVVALSIIVAIRNAVIRTRRRRRRRNRRRSR